jgi:hypothetical protein
MAWAGACVSTDLSASTCSPPSISGALSTQGTGEALTLHWTAQGDARQFRLWAQWRVPEGEVVRTHEVIVSAREASLPPSPARWRPLKLSVELQAICGDGLVSSPTRAHQLQFDAAAEAACPPVDGLLLDQSRMQLSWGGERHDRISLSFHHIEDGTAQAVHLAVTGSMVDWPAAVRRPAVIRAVRACGEVQRSRETFQLVP